jgi:hypothetical protein
VKLTIRSCRCSAEITFKTDPKNQDYACERGAKRNTEPWRVGNEETDEERLDRLEQEAEERNAMVELEAKTVDAKREMAVADALDEIRSRNARLERADRDGVELAVPEPEDDDAARQEREDAEAAKRAFASARKPGTMEDIILEDEDEDVLVSTDMAPPPIPTFKKTPVVKKKIGPAALGIKKKEPPKAEKKAALVSYGSDSD